MKLCVQISNHIHKCPTNTTFNEHPQFKTINSKSVKTGVNGWSCLLLEHGHTTRKKDSTLVYFIGINITDSEALGVFKLPFSGFLK